MILAQGCYRYQLNGETQPIVEPWDLSRTAEGLLLQGQRRVNNHPVLRVQAHYRGIVCHRMQVRWQSTDTDSTRSFQYRWHDNTLLWHSQQQSQQRMPPPAGTLLFPLLRAATGVLLPPLAQRPGTLVLPNLRNPQDDDFLQPLISQRHSQLCEQADGLDRYRYFGGEYGESGSDYWLNAAGFVHRYRWESGSGCWQIALDDFVAQADFQWNAES